MSFRKRAIFPRISHKIEKCFKHCTAQPDKKYMLLYDEFLTKCLSNPRSESTADFTYKFNELKFTQIHVLFMTANTQNDHQNSKNLYKIWSPGICDTLNLTHGRTVHKIIFWHGAYLVYIPYS
jgi:hypothetical protein